MAKTKRVVAHVHRGDTVVVIKGRERGKRGVVKRVLPTGRVEIEKVQMIKRHTKPTQKNPQGGIQDLEGSVALSNVLLWCETCTAPRRSKAQVTGQADDQTKVRSCTKCSSTFSNPGM